MVSKKGKAATVPRPAPDWSWVELENITDESELTTDHLRKAIGLGLARPCRNKLQAEPEPEVMVIDLDEDDTDKETADSSKERHGAKIDVKGKGKASIKSRGNDEVWGPPCTGTWCQDNLLCLNHLGGKAVSRIVLLNLVSKPSSANQWNAKGKKPRSMPTTNVDLLYLSFQMLTTDSSKLGNWVAVPLTERSPAPPSDYAISVPHAT